MQPVRGRNGGCHHEDPPAWDDRRARVQPLPKPTQEDIAAAAFQIYLSEGCQEGQEMRHWYEAEAQLTAIPWESP